MCSQLLCRVVLVENTRILGGTEKTPRTLLGGVRRMKELLKINNLKTSNG